MDYPQSTGIAAARASTTMIIPQPGTKWKLRSGHGSWVIVQTVSEPYHRNGRFWPSQVTYSFRHIGSEPRTIALSTFTTLYAPLPL